MAAEHAQLRSLLTRAGERVAHHAPWPRWRVSEEVWIAVGRALGQGSLDLFALWADALEVHAAVLGLEEGLTVVSIAVAGGGYPSLSAHHLPALRLERTIRDLFGHRPEGLPDPRPWLDHGVWPGREGAAGEPYRFLPVKGEGLHQIPVGPVHAGIIEPGHFRFTANGETVARLEERLGYVHKGVERHMEGRTLLEGARICCRVSGDSTVAYSIAYARAAESALGVTVPDRAHALRGLMAELERMANHFGDIGAICNDAAFALLFAHFGLLREEVLQAAAECFGHRLMMDQVVPGGVVVDVDERDRIRLEALLTLLDKRLPQLLEVYDGTPSLKDRTRMTGTLSHDLARRFAAGGYVGRGSGRSFDSRRDLAYPPYDRLEFEVSVLEAGDVNARVWIRAMEIAQSMAMIRQILAALPAGAVLAPVSVAGSGPREGCAVAEAFRGDVFVWLRLDAEGKILRCHPRDASWFQWPLLEAVIEGNIVADFPLCNKSFNCSYSGHDL